MDLPLHLTWPWYPSVWRVDVEYHPWYSRGVPRRRHPAWYRRFPYPPVAILLFLKSTTTNHHSSYLVIIVSILPNVLRRYTRVLWQHHHPLVRRVVRTSWRKHNHPIQWGINSEHDGRYIKSPTSSSLREYNVRVYLEIVDDPGSDSVGCDVGGYCRDGCDPHGWFRRW